MSENGGESGRNSPPIWQLVLAAFNAAAAVFVAIMAMQGGDTKAHIDRLTAENVALRIEARDHDRRLTRLETLAESRTRGADE